MKKNFLKVALLIICCFGLTNLALAGTPPTCNPKDINGAMLVIAFAPLVLFLLTVIFFFLKLGKEGYKLGDALKENSTIDVSVNNPAEEPKAAAPVQDGAQQLPKNDENPEQAAQGAGVAPNNVTTPVKPTVPFVGKTIQPKSTSRILAFLSGLVSLGIACCLTSFWLYRFFECNEAPELKDLTNVLLSLGIGIIPYAVNKISTGASSTKNTD